MKFFNKIKGFTLAEVMITLMIIGIISAIAIPVALHSKPDENLIKFKKAHETLAQVINTLVTSDKYFLAGDLGVSANGVVLTENEELGNRPYFCKSMADLLTTKLVDCAAEKSKRTGSYTVHLLSNETAIDVIDNKALVRQVTPETTQATKEQFDFNCKKYAKVVGPEIITADDVVFYQTGESQFGSSHYVTPNAANGLSTGVRIRYFSPPDKFPAYIADEQGFDIAYKNVCIDVDGIPNNATATDCKNECPFGYGIRADGKILPGARAEEWLKKDISGKKEDEES